MTDIVKTNLRADPREVPQLFMPGAPIERPQHWLLLSWYGRDLLKAALRKLRPELAVPTWRHAPELDCHLEAIIDELQLRAWERPRTVFERARYVFTVAKLYPTISRGDWRVRHFTK